MSSENKLGVILAGVSGWAGGAVARAILGSNDMTLVGAVARSSAGQSVAKLLAVDNCSLTVSASCDDALAQARARGEGADVFIDYTSAHSVKANVLWALEQGLSTVVGSSGLSGADFDEIEKLAVLRNLAVIACGNFSITAALAKHFSLLAAKYLPHWEIIDYAHSHKIDSPSGTARELAEAMAEVAVNKLDVPVEKTVGAREARGAQIAGSPVHSVRLPGLTLSFETLFGLPDERLSIRHDAGSGAGPYVEGTLLAVRKLPGRRGLTRGMDTLLFT